ncbi:MAG: hypothetical protein U1D55_01140 [Phycisphaerae bacterium]
MPDGRYGVGRRGPTLQAQSPLDDAPRNDAALAKRAAREFQVDSVLSSFEQLPI